MMLGSGLSRRFIPGLLLLSNISDESFLSIVSANSKSVDCPNCGQLAESVAGHTPTLSKSVILKIVDTVAALKATAAAYEDLSQFLAWISAGLCDVPELSSPDGLRISTLLERLSTLIKAKGVIEVVAKARDVITDNQRVFLETRILTDLRPVFDVETLEEPAGAVIIHNLKLVFSESFVSREFFLTLDESDLERLEFEISRARRKADALKHVWHKTKIPFVNVDLEA